MVKILFAAFGIATGGLDMPMRMRAYPDRLPGRGNFQASNPCQMLFTLNALALFVQVPELAPHPLPTESGRDIFLDVMQLLRMNDGYPLSFL